MSRSDSFGNPEVIAFTFKDIELATNDFAAENLIAETSTSKVYKVQRLQSEEDKEVELFNVFVHVLKYFLTQETVFAIPEASVPLESVNNNIISIVGFCGTRDEEITMIVTKNEANGSLDKHLSSQTLTWIQRLRICVATAHAIRYLHHDFHEEVSVIHGNIKSSRILLNDKWEPKLFGFDNSVLLVLATQQLVRISKYGGALQYMDPAFEKTGGINHKSDVFSLGVVLFEVLFGQKASIQNDNKWYFADLARRHYEETRLDEMIDPHLRQQMDSQSLHIFSETAYRCLKEQREQRLDTSQLVKKLEKALEHQLRHESPELAPDKRTSIDSWKGKSLEHLRIQLSDIKLATRNFAETNLIGSGGYGMVYRAELDHYDGRNSLNIEEKDRDLWPKRRSIVAIKCILGTEGRQGFFAEIEMLTNCKHQNIVSLLGFCDEDRHMILVYELLSNGSLDDYLGSTTNYINLTWAQRIHICLDIAHGLDYLHTSTKDKPTIIHRDIKSANILLDNNWNAKIADFGLSKLHPMNQIGSTLKTNNLAGTEVYMDPEYMETGKLKKESDIYSFGIVLFEIMCGRLTYDGFFYVDNDKGIPSVARRLFSEGRLKEMVDPNIKQAYGNILMINRGLNEDSLDTFSTIAYQCVEEAQSRRPTMEIVITELEKALSYEENHKDNLNISIEDIKLATQNFNDMNCVGSGRYWKKYKGEVSHANDDGHTTVVAKRWDTNYDRRHHQFLSELDILFKFKHKNIIDVVGYCEEMDERIVVYENMSKGSLDKYLNDASLTWMKRLNICIDVARGIEFLHGGKVEMGELVIHGRIKSANILVDGDWNAKISNFHMSFTFPQSKEIVDAINDNNETLGYLNPQDMEQSLVYPRSDIYSLGVVLFEIFCGRLAWPEKCEDHSLSLGPLAKCRYDEGKLDQMVFEDIKERIVPKSLTTFQRIAYRCLNDDLERRPKASEVVVELEKALEFQVDVEIWKTKLPKDYKEILQMSKVASNYSSETNKELYDMLRNGILIQDNNVWFSLGENGERSEMISARKFWHKRRWSRKWRTVPQSRFPKVAEVLDVSNLMIHIKIKAQYLSPGVNYRVYFIFRFCSLTKSRAERMYVNLKYKKGNETLHAYFATWRDDDWMMIELCQFLYCKDDNDFEVLLESFSRCYCGSNTIYVEGIEFQAIDNAIQENIDEKLKGFEAIENASFEVLKHEEIEKTELHEVNASFNNIDNLKQIWKSNRKGDKWRYLLSKMNKKKDHMLSEVNTTKDHLGSAKEAFTDSFDKGLSNLEPLAQSRVETNYEELCKRCENYDGCEESILISKVNDKKHLMLSAKKIMYNSTKVKLIHLKASARSRFQEVVELLSQQVLRIKCRIKSELLQPNTEYACYLVFKFSKNCFGLNCPMIVRDLHHWRNKEARIVYFRSPSYWNLHDSVKVPEKREDGWMEVNVWEFNSTSRLREDFVPVHLKMITYEGTLSGLILCGMEIRAM